MWKRREEVGSGRGSFELWVLMEGGRMRVEVVFDLKVVVERRRKKK